MSAPKPRYKDPSMQKCYESALAVAEDPAGEFYYNGEQHRGAGHRCAFWDGFNGVEKTPHAIPGTMSWAFFQAGKTFARRREQFKCLRDHSDENMQGPCSAGQCQWPNCKTTKQ
jgi:hypothetical protein